MQNEPISQEPMPQIQASNELPALPAPRQEAQPSPTRWRRALGCMLRIGLSVLVIVVLAALVYFGWPVVYARYILPVQTNTTRIAAVETHQQAGQDQLSAMATAQAEQAAALSATIAALESAGKASDQALSTAQAAQAGQAAALATLAPRLKALESDVKKQSDALAALQSTQSALQSTQGALQTTQTALHAGDASGRAELDRQITLLKSMELLSRARLFLYESNFSLAKQDIQAARNLLATLPDPPGAPSLAEVVLHLDQAITRLPDFPVAASDDLDTAWQLLLGGSPQTAASETTPAPTETPGVTPTP